MSRGSGSARSHGDRAGRSLLILGLGNLLCGDDGAGVRAVERLLGAWVLPEGARALDGGTLGLSLLAHIRDCDDLILVDAVCADAPPGTLVRLTGDEVESAARHRLSIHQIGVADLLDGLRLLDEFPRRIALLGVVPGILELQLGCSLPVEASLESLVEAVVEEAASLGWVLERRVEDEDSIPDRLARAGGGPRL